MTKFESDWFRKRHDFPEPITSFFRNYYSVIAKQKVDCIEGKRTWLSFTIYSQLMGRGRILGERTTKKITYPSST